MIQSLQYSLRSGSGSEIKACSAPHLEGRLNVLRLILSGDRKILKRARKRAICIQATIYIPAQFPYTNLWVSNQNFQLINFFPRSAFSTRIIIRQKVFFPGPITQDFCDLFIIKSIYYLFCRYIRFCSQSIII